MIPERDHRTNKENQANLFRRSFPAKLSVYDQATLEFLSFLTNISNTQFFKKSAYEIGVIFQLQGELKGIALSLINIKNIEISKDELIELQSLHIECSNILLGHFLTTLENSSGIMGAISSPRILQVTDPIPKAIVSLQSQHQIAAKYNLKLSHKNYKCDFYIMTEICSISEV